MKLALAFAAVLAALSMGTAPARAMTDPFLGATKIGFERVTNNGAPDAAGQLLAEVIDGFGTTAGGALFRFSQTSNSPNAAASITDIYFDDRASLFLPPPTVVSALTSPAGVRFADPANPNNVTGANAAVPPFRTTSGLSIDSDAPVNANGIHFGEFLTLRLAYQNGTTFADVLAALLPTATFTPRNGAPVQFAPLRIGLRMQALNFSSSDGFVSTPGVTPIPLPMGAWFAITAVGAFGALSARRRTASAI